MRRTRNLILSLLLVAILAVTCWLVFRNSNEETVTDTPVEPSTTIYEVDSGALTGLSWSWEGETLSLALENDRWVYGNAPDTPIDASSAAALAALASSIDYLKALDEGAVASEFGFDTPRMQLRLYLGDVTADLEIGMRNDYAGGDYLRYQDRIYLIDTALYDGFAIGLQDLIPQDVLPSLSSSEISQLTLTTSAGSRSLYQPEAVEGKPRSDFYSWYETETETPVSSAAVSKTISSAINLSWADCIAYQPDTLSIYGLDQPTLTLEYQYTTSDSDGASLEGSVCLLFGSYTEAENLLGGTEDLESVDSLEEAETPERYVYAKLADSDLVYTINASKLESLLEAAEAYWGPTTVTQVTWASLRAMRLTAGSQTVRLGIDRVESQDDEGNAITNTYYDVDGRESSYEEIYTVFQQLRSMSANTLDRAQTPEEEPVLTVEFYRDSDLNSVVTVRFYSYDNSFYLVEADGTARLIVSRRDVQALIDTIHTLQSSS